MVIELPTLWILDDLFSLCVIRHMLYSFIHKIFNIYHVKSRKLRNVMLMSCTTCHEASHWNLFHAIGKWISHSFEWTTPLPSVSLKHPIPFSSHSWYFYLLKQIRLEWHFARIIILGCVEEKRWWKIVRNYCSEFLMNFSFFSLTTKTFSKSFKNSFFCEL